MKDELLYEMQHSFPMEPYPFEQIAKRMGMGENQVLNTVKKLKGDGIIRQTSAIFDTKRLGYKSSLVAFKVDEIDIEKAADIINQHPGVSHNYLRNHEYNIWFTIAVPPDSIFGLEKSVEILRKQTGASSAIVLPTLKMFKISVKMDTTGKKATKEKVKKLNFKDIELTPRYIEVIKELQKDIEVTREPFEKSIQKLGMSNSEFFKIAHELKDAGVMRRFATILNHRKAGFGANAMSVWNVPEDIAEETGKRLAEFSAVSHCYLRPSYPEWPYNLFAMVHAKSQEECDELIGQMARENNLDNYSKLYSSIEFKKQRLVYFDDKFREWEENAASEI